MNWLLMIDWTIIMIKLDVWSIDVKWFVIWSDRMMPIISATEETEPRMKCKG